MWIWKSSQNWIAFITLLPCYLFIHLNLSLGTRFQVQHINVAVTSFLPKNHPSHLSSANLFKSTSTPCCLRLTGIFSWALDLFHMKGLDLRRLPGDVQFMGFCGWFCVEAKWISAYTVVGSNKSSYWWSIIMNHDLHHHFVWTMFFGSNATKTWCSSNCFTFYETYGHSHHMNMTDPATRVASAAPFSSQHHICCQLFHRFDNVHLHLQNDRLLQFVS